MCKVIASAQAWGTRRLENTEEGKWDNTDQTTSQHSPRVKEWMVGQASVDKLCRLIGFDNCELKV